MRRWGGGLGNGTEVPFVAWARGGLVPVGFWALGIKIQELQMFARIEGIGGLGAKELAR